MSEQQTGHAGRCVFQVGALRLASSFAGRSCGCNWTMRPRAPLHPPNEVWLDQRRRVPPAGVAPPPAPARGGRVGHTCRVGHVDACTRDLRLECIDRADDAGADRRSARANPTRRVGERNCLCDALNPVIGPLVALDEHLRSSAVRVLRSCPRSQRRPTPFRPAAPGSFCRLLRAQSGKRRRRRRTGRRELGAWIEDASKQVAAANAALTTLYWRTGRRVAQEILGDGRAEYGGQIVAAVAPTVGGALALRRRERRDRDRPRSSVGGGVQRFVRDLRRGNGRAARVPPWCRYQSPRARGVRCSGGISQPKPG